jgi:anti-sigma B factor antagonist
MELHYTKLDSDIGLLKLTGQLDIFGLGEVEVKFTGYCSGEGNRVIVDLSSVDFLASIGIRLLTANAKSLSTRGGKLVLLAPQPQVKEVLDITGISPIIPIFMELEAAEAALSA